MIQYWVCIEVSDLSTLEFLDEDVSESTFLHMNFSDWDVSKSYVLVVGARPEQILVFCSVQHSYTIEMYLTIAWVRPANGSDLSYFRFGFHRIRIQSAHWQA